MPSDQNLDDPRRKYLEEYKEAVDRHRTRHFDYEVKAIEFANNAFRVLTYLNGGALVAIPASVALFQADIKTAKTQLICAGAMFIASLLLVVMAQGAAFFTMARRSESEQCLQYAEAALLNLRYYSKDETDRDACVASASSFQTKANTKVANSNWWRVLGLSCFWLSLVLFILGCLAGARAVLGV